MGALSRVGHTGAAPSVWPALTTDAVEEPPTSTQFPRAPQAGAEFPNPYLLPALGPTLVCVCLHLPVSVTFLCLRLNVSINVSMSVEVCRHVTSL